MVASVNKQSLMPPNSTSIERDIEQIAAGVEDIALPHRSLWNPDTCPVALLPWLAWALSLDSWKSYWPESVKRARIKAAMEIQRHKGTAKSVRDVVTSFGGALSLKEWWQNNPPTAPYTFDILLTVGAGMPATAEYQQDIIDDVSRTKPVRAHFTMTAGLSALGNLGLFATVRGAVFKRLRTIEAPWRGGLGIEGTIRPVTYTRIRTAEA